MSNGNNSALAPSSNDMAITVLSQLLPISIVITLVNGLVFILFYRRRSLRTASNYLLLGLAVCDFLTGAVNIPYFITFAFRVVESSDFNYWLFILHNFIAVAAAYHILAITAERYFAIMKPLKHHVVTKVVVLKVLAGIWFISAVITMIPLTWQTSELLFLWLSIHAAVCLLLVFLIPYTFIVFAYTVMFRLISSRRKSRLLAGKRRAKKQNRNNNDRKCLFIFATMAAIFAVCWFPYFTLTLVVDLDIYFMRPLVNDKIVEAFVIIRYLTSITNPLLYTFFKRDFWTALKNLPLKRGLSFPAQQSRKGSSLTSTINLKLQRKSHNGRRSTRSSLISTTETKVLEATVSSPSTCTEVFVSSV